MRARCPDCRTNTAVAIGPEYECHACGRSFGAGLVRVTLNGKGEMRGVKIDPKVVDPADTEMLQDLIVAAHRAAREKVDAASQAEMQKVTGGLQLPPGMKLPF